MEVNRLFCVPVCGNQSLMVHTLITGCVWYRGVIISGSDYLLIFFQQHLSWWCLDVFKYLSSFDITVIMIYIHVCFGLSECQFCPSKWSSFNLCCKKCTFSWYCRKQIVRETQLVSVNFHAICSLQLNTVVCFMPINCIFTWLYNVATSLFK